MVHDVSEEELTLSVGGLRCFLCCFLAFNHALRVLYSSVFYLYLDLNRAQTFRGGGIGSRTMISVRTACDGIDSAQKGVAYIAHTPQQCIVSKLICQFIPRSGQCCLYWKFSIPPAEWLHNTLVITVIRADVPVKRRQPVSVIANLVRYEIFQRGRRPRTGDPCRTRQRAIQCYFGTKASPPRRPGHLNVILSSRTGRGPPLAAPQTNLTSRLCLPRGGATCHPCVCM